MFFHSDLCLSADVLVSESRSPLLTVVTFLIFFAFSDLHLSFVCGVSNS